MSKRLCETMLALGLAASLVLTGCGAQGGGNQQANPDAGANQTSTQAGGASGGATAGGESTGGTSAPSDVSALEGWWKTTSVKSELWSVSQDALEENQELFESAGALTINSSDNSFVLSTIGGNLAGTIKPTEDPSTFELAYTVVDGFTGIKSAECKVVDGDHLQISVTEDFTTSASDKIQPIHITIECLRTHEYDSYDSVWDRVEELHIKNRDAAQNSVPINRINPMKTIGESEDGYVGILGTGETDTEFCLLLLFSSYRQNWLSINENDLSSEFTVNGNRTVNVKLATVLPPNSEEKVADPSAKLEGRVVLVRLPKSVVGGQLTSFKGTADITTLDLVPIATLEFSYTF